MKRNFLPDSKGSLTIVAVIALSVVVFICGGVIDFMSLVNQHRQMQTAADSAAIASASELLLGPGSKQNVDAVAKSYVAATIHTPHTTTADVIEDGKAVRVQVSARRQAIFSNPLSQSDQPVVVEAIAEVAGSSNPICTLALEPSDPRAIYLDAKAKLAASKCSIYSNSAAGESIMSLGSSRLEANLICASGGARSASDLNFKPAPITDCPRMADPLINRAAPKVGACDYNNTTVSSGKVKLGPGVYCGGIKIMGASNVTLSKGAYILKNGPLMVDGTSKLVGTNVGFYLTGQGATFSFTGNSSISLSAPNTGPLAGLLFFEDHASPKNQMHQITTSFANYLVGTVYLPRNVLRIDTGQGVAEASEFTVLVVNKLHLQNGPQLVLNTRYNDIDIPVPDGVGPNTGAGRVRLTQ